MVMTCQPLWDAVKAVEKQNQRPATRILMTPQGQTLTQKIAKQLAQHERLLIIAGHYEGIDQRVIQRLDPIEISIGDYVLTGGELPAMVLIDRLLELGSSVRVYDLAAADNVRAIYGDRLEYAATPADALDGADALAIVTEWGDFRAPDFTEMARRMASPVIFDGRNLYDPADMKEIGFTYYAIGRPAVFADAVENPAEMAGH